MYIGIIIQNIQITKKDMVYATFSDEFKTKSILDSMNMKNTLIFYDHYHLKWNLD